MFTLLKQTIQLSPGDRRLLCEAVSLLVVSRLGLVLMPLKSLRAILGTTSRRRRSVDNACEQDSAPRVAWAIERARRCVPGATCLPQALAAEWLLRRRGQQSDLKIGVVKDRDGHLLAHAWVESHGRIVVGGLPNLASFAVLNAHTSPLL